MADFESLNALEYDTSKAGELSRLIAPPYDVIDAETREALAAASPYNVVRLILPQAEAGLDRYQAAARLARGWIERGILVRAGRAFFVIEQRFELEGADLVRTAVLGRVRLDAWRANGVFPHEVTLPKPKADRLNLYRALGIQPGPVFALFEDDSKKVSQILARVKNAPPYRTADAPEGALDRIWKVADEATITHLETALAGERFFVADGHHRYETALSYRDELASRGRLDKDHPANFVMTAAVSFADPGLAILPTHRLIRMNEKASLGHTLRTLERDYEIDQSERLDRLSTSDSADAAIAVYADGLWRRLRLKSTSRREMEAELGALMAGLNVSEVRKRVLTAFFEDVDAAVAEEHIAYTHQTGEAVARVDAGEFDAAVVLAPISVRTMAQVAAQGMTMPPKSTYFYPKIPTGVALNPLS